MGQYYHPLLISDDDTKIMLNAHEFDNGLKLMESAWIGNNYVNAIYSLIRDTPRRVAWIGDYAMDGFGPYKHKIPGFRKYYNSVWKTCTAVELKPENFSETDFKSLTEETTDMYLVNHTTKEYLDLYAYMGDNTVLSGDYAGWCVDPLPLLTACGNGQGGGDYHSEVGMDNIGIWAFDLLEYTDTVPNGYEGVSFYFEERE